MRRFGKNFHGIFGFEISFCNLLLAQDVYLLLCPLSIVGSRLSFILLLAFTHGAETKNGENIFTGLRIWLDCATLPSKK